VALSSTLREGAAAQMLLEPGLIVQASAAYTLPAHFSEYTDCCTGIHHGGQAVHLDNPLLPNYKWVPSGATTLLRLSWSAAPRCAARWARPRAAMTRRRSASASAWIANSNSAS
jgi:hypothetical protein